MSVIIALFVIGALFLGAEIFLPGGILGFFGALALIGGSALAFLNFGVQGGAMALIAGLVLVGLVLYFEFLILPKTSLGKRLFLTSSLSGTSAPARDAEYVGRVGITETTLGPSGYITIDGRRHEAFSRSGLLARGVPVKVVGADNFRLIVTPNNSPS